MDLTEQIEALIGKGAMSADDLMPTIEADNPGIYNRRKIVRALRNGRIRGRFVTVALGTKNRWQKQGTTYRCTTPAEKIEYQLSRKTPSLTDRMVRNTVRRVPNSVFALGAM